jgi:hypothetical protein
MLAVEKHLYSSKDEEDEDAAYQTDLAMADLDLEMDNCWAHLMDAFVERGRLEFLASRQFKDLAEKWVRAQPRKRDITS